MIYVFIKRDKDENRPYVDMPREYRVGFNVRQVLNLGDEEELKSHLQMCHEGIYAIEGAKSSDGPQIECLLKGFSQINPGCVIELLETKMVAQSPPGECVIQSVSKNGVLPV